MQSDEKRRFKTLLYEQFARVGKALANPHRLELLDVLAQGERTVEALAAETGMPLANASQHLQILRAARLVETRRAGVAIYYRLASDTVGLLWLSLRRVGEEHLAEIDRVVETFLQDRQLLQPVEADELLHLLSEDQVILLDVRPREEYAAAHLPQARSMPLAELAARLDELPKGREIVAYCRGPYCVFADEALALLHAHGYRARRLREGVLEWRQLGLPVMRYPTRQTSWPLTHERGRKEEDEHDLC
jgi:rhodanese-related sulfurtransferase/DNA-binding transcriptional ArsR family regulator